MSKAQIAVCLDLETIELLSELKTCYHLKNNSKAIELIIRQWQNLLSDRQKLQNMAEKKQKPVNPFVNP